MAFDHAMELDSAMLFDLLPILMALVLGIVIVYVFVSSQRKEYKRHVQQLQTKKPREFKIYTRDEVAKHASRHDAWVIIKNKETGEKRVYDVTEYVDEHPGGDAILNNAGGDATEGFHGPQHPATVFLMTEEYLIGRLDE